MNTIFDLNVQTEQTDLNSILLYKISHPIIKNTIQIYHEDSGTKTIEAFTFKIPINKSSEPAKQLIEYSIYYETKIYVSGRRVTDVCDVINAVIIYKNNDSSHELASITNDNGFGAIVAGYHYYYNNAKYKYTNKLIEQKLNNCYIGFVSGYCRFPTVENALLYEFDDY
jgi:hypothetical protein